MWWGNPYRWIKQGKDIKGLRGSGRVAILHTLMKEDLFEKVIFKQRLEGEKGSHNPISGEFVPGWGIKSATEQKQTCAWSVQGTARRLKWVDERKWVDSCRKGGEYWPFLEGHSKEFAFYYKWNGEPSC